MTVKKKCVYFAKGRIVYCKTYRNDICQKSAFLITSLSLKVSVSLKNTLKGPLVEERIE